MSFKELYRVVAISLAVLPCCSFAADDWRYDESECGVLIRWMQSTPGFPAGKILDARPVKDWRLSRCGMAPEIKKGYYLREACEGDVMGHRNKGIFFWSMRAKKMGAQDFIDEGRFRFCK